MALALLAATIIENIYDQLLLTMATHLKNTLNDLLKYFEEQWFEKVPIQQWCIYGLSMRTNNNTEGKQISFSFVNLYSCFSSSILQSFQSSSASTSS
jgi:hypothetical protein